MEERFDIAYIISHGFAARMLIQTDLLGKLVNAGKKIAIISVDINDPVLVNYSGKYQISLFDFDERGNSFNENYMFKRKYFLEDLKANPALWEKHIYAIKYTKSKNPFKRLRPFYYGLIYRLIPFFPILRKRFIINEKKYLKSNKAKELLERIHPKKLISTYPVDYNEAVLLHYGNTMTGIETWIHLLSWDNITCKGHFPEIANKYISWGPIMSNELIEYYNIASNNIYECGVPHFDLHIKIRNDKVDKNSILKEYNLNTNKPCIFFAMSSPRFAPCEIEIVEWLAQEIENGKLRNVQMIIRPHPQNVTGYMADLSWIDRLNKLNEKNGIAVDFPEINQSKLAWSMKDSDMYKLSKLISCSSIVINSGSTVSIDALMHYKPVIITSFDGDKKYNYWKSARRLIDFTHLKKLIDLEGILPVFNYTELLNSIEVFLKDPEAKRNRRISALKVECCDPESYATDKIVSVLSS